MKKNIFLGILVLSILSTPLVYAEEYDHSHTEQIGEPCYDELVDRETEAQYGSYTKPPLEFGIFDS